MEHTYDNSQLGSFQRCAYSYYLQYIRGLKTTQVNTNFIRLSFGNYVHLFIENYLKETGKNINDIVDGYESLESEKNKSIDCLKMLCKGYATFYNNEKMEVLAVEEPIKFNIGKYQYVVKVDAVVNMNGNILGLEHKTTDALSFNYFDKYDMDGQITSQVVAIKNKFGRCDGIIVDAMMINKLQGNPRSLYDFVETTKEGIYCCKFRRQPFNRTDEEVNNWEENAIRWIDEIEDCIINNNFKKSTSTGACGYCSYPSLCKTAIYDKLDETVLSGFTKCDPYQYLKSKGE